MKWVLRTNRLTKSFGGLIAVNNIDFDLSAGETLGIIGPNGAGKTTLFNLLTGPDRPDHGTIEFNGNNITEYSSERKAGLGFARTFQHGRVFGNLTVLDNIKIGAQVRRRKPGFWPGVKALAHETLAAVCVLPSYRNEETRLTTEAMNILAIFQDRLLPRLHDPAFSLSYANRRRLEIARALAVQPSILFLDEPTAGMNPAETEEMVGILRTLKQHGQTMMIIEHKLPLILPVSDRIIVMDEGRKIAEGDPLRISLDPVVIEAYLGHSHFITHKEA